MFSPFSAFQSRAVRAALPAGLALAAPLVLYSASRAARGEKLADASANSLSYIGVPALTTVLGAMTGNPLLGLAFGFLPAWGLDRRLNRAFRTFSALDRQVHRLECGGAYRDTLANFSLRRRALSDMSGAMANSRRHLGNEALLLHQ